MKVCQELVISYKEKMTKRINECDFIEARGNLLLQGKGFNSVNAKYLLKNLK